MIWKIFGLFLNTLTANDKYSLLNRDNLLQLLQMIISHKQKTFFEFVLGFSKFTFNFECFRKKDEPHSWCIFKLMDFKNVVRSMSKRSGSEEPSTSDMVNGPKHCWNLKGTSFITFIGHYEGNLVAKSLSWWYAKYSDCSLTHWLPMTSIVS